MWSWVKKKLRKLVSIAVQCRKGDERQTTEYLDDDDYDDYDDENEDEEEEESWLPSGRDVWGLMVRDDMGGLWDRGLRWVLSEQTFGWQAGRQAGKQALCLLPQIVATDDLCLDT
ncbi:hypothetical protein M0802_010818 [Mischocyttarus mexicanus]|nr:hypothetical protein M0802_010818 [Mischocyttarus mexicanus]